MIYILVILSWLNILVRRCLPPTNGSIYCWSSWSNLNFLCNYTAPVPNCAGIKKYFLLFTLSGFLKKNASIKSIFSQTNQRKFSLDFLPFPDYSFSTDSITFLWNNTLQPHQTKQIATRYKNFDDSLNLVASVNSEFQS